MITMYSTARLTRRSREYWNELSEMSGSVAESIPTLDRQLDSFFHRNADAIIEEWDLVTDEDLAHIQRSIDYLSHELNRLAASKNNLEKRVMNLKSAIYPLEAGQ